jgi:hypothetical protein
MINLQSIITLLLVFIELIKDQMKLKIEDHDKMIRKMNDDLERINLNIIGTVSLNRFQ